MNQEPARQSGLVHSGSTCTSTERGIGENGTIAQDTWSLTTALLSSLDHTGNNFSGLSDALPSILSMEKDGVLNGGDPVSGCVTQTVTREDMLNWEFLNFDGFP